MDRQSGCLCCDSGVPEKGAHCRVEKLLIVLVDERPRVAGLEARGVCERRRGVAQ